MVLIWRLLKAFYIVIVFCLIIKEIQIILFINNGKYEKYNKNQFLRNSYDKHLRSVKHSCSLYTIF